MINAFEEISIILNKLLFKEENLLCYTVYRDKSIWYKIFNGFFFWQKNHCRKVYLMKRIHNGRTSMNTLTARECQEFSKTGCEDCIFCTSYELCTKEREKNAILKQYRELK